MEPASNRDLVIRSDGTTEGLLSSLADAITSFPSTAVVGFHVAIREIQSEFRINRLGLAWMFMTPLLYVIAFVFVRRGIEMHGGTGTMLPSAALALSGVVIFQTWFDSAMNQLTALSRNQSLIKNIGIAPETFLYAGIAKSAFMSLPKAGLVIAVSAGTAGYIPETGQAVAFLAVVAVSCLTGSGFGYLLSPLGAILNDIRMALQSASMALLVGSAVFFDPGAFRGTTAHFVLGLNPVACLVDAGRSALFGTDMTLAPYFVGWMVVSVALLPFAIVFTRMSRRIVMERL